MKRTKRRARLLAYWPGIDSAIVRVVRACKPCSEALPSLPKRPIKFHDKPSRVFEHMSTDLFSHGGQTFIVVADVKSGWTTTHHLGNKTSARDIISALRKIFCDTAVPVILYSDGGPQFTSQHTKKFLGGWGICHIISSPAYPQSNGHAEASVKAMKKLVKRCWCTAAGDIDYDKWARGLLQWRNMPRTDRLSPAQIVFGHPAMDTLPVHKRSFSKEWQTTIKDVDALAANRTEKLERAANSSAHPLPWFKGRSTGPCYQKVG